MALAGRWLLDEPPAVVLPLSVKPEELSPPGRQDTAAAAVDPAFEGFCRDVRPKLVAFLAVQHGRHVAEELTQETLARVYLHWRTVGRLRRPPAWAFRVAINLANSWSRRRAAERRALRYVEGDGEGRHADHDDALAVRAAVRRLPRRQRNVVLLRYFVGLTVEETAATLHCTPGTVKSDTHDAIRSLRSRGGLDDVGRDLA